MMRSSVLNSSFIDARTPSANFLMKFGFLDASLNTQVLDLRRTINELHKDIRHGHDSDIDKASKILTAKIFDYATITKDIFNEYVALHHKDSGRMVRNEITFDMMYDWIKDGNAFLTVASKENKSVGFSYFFLFKNNVYYGSACNEPGMKDIPIAHFIQWKTIEWMHEKNFSFYEIGWQYY